jgi:hypothetical protein
VTIAAFADRLQTIRIMGKIRKNMIQHAVAGIGKA